MLNVIKKELKLFIVPAIYLILLLNAFIVIPSYPSFVGISYGLLFINICLNVARANNDNLFTAMLPIPRNHIVLSKHFSICWIEVLQILTAIPFACISIFVINPMGNPIGIDSNLTFFGLAFLCYGIFNLIFLPWYFKTGTKAGMPMLVGAFAYIIFYILCEVIMNMVPSIGKALDGHSIAMVGYRVIVFVIGIVFYALSLLISYKLSIKNFKRVTI